MEPAPVAARAGRRAGSHAPARARCRSATDAFDAVVACLVFEHIRDVDDAIAEVARVLVPGGRFCFFLNHPLLQTPNSGWIDDQVLDPPEQYWRIGPYLIEDETIEEVEKDVLIPFIHRPLSRYINALADRGLLLERMDEPAPPPGFLARAAEYEAAATIPGCCTCGACNARELARRAPSRRYARRVTDIVVIAGLSGAGRTAAADVSRISAGSSSTTCRPSLVEKIVELATRPGRASIAWRSSPAATTAPSSTRCCRCGPRQPGAVLFLEAQDAELVRRYDATRASIRSRATSTGWSRRSSSSGRCSSGQGDAPT